MASRTTWRSILRSTWRIKTGGELPPPNWLRVEELLSRFLDDRSASTVRRERRPASIMIGGNGRASIERWLRVTEHARWGAASPFDLVDGGKEGFIKAILDASR